LKQTFITLSNTLKRFLDASGYNLHLETEFVFKCIEIEQYQKGKD